MRMKLFTLENKNGLKLTVSNYGAIVLDILVPDRDGRLADISLGFDSPEEYASKPSPYFGTVVGRFGNRIAKGRFELDGVEYKDLAINNGPNHLHGGRVGFDKVAWKAEPFSGDGFQGIKLSYLSKDGEEGYPGNLLLSVTYTLTDANEWVIEYEATTDKATVCNPTQHAYFNLGGQDAGDLSGHELQIKASHFTVTDDSSIPTGEIRPVKGSALDFTQSKEILRDIDADEEQIVFGFGYDHNFVLDKGPGAFALAATAYHPASGRELKVYTTEPGVQFYSGNHLDGKTLCKGGRVYQPRAGFCLETQHFPDSPNKGHFPSTTLRPGEVFRSKTVYAFGVR